ncbi:MAG: hypothetical protein AB7V62_08080 [Thermoleophilia bacterium]
MTNEYVVAAYGVVLFAFVVYVVVIGLRSARQAREAELLAKLVESRLGDEEDEHVAAAVGPVDR